MPRYLCLQLAWVNMWRRRTSLPLTILMMGVNIKILGCVTAGQPGTPILVDSQRKQRDSGQKAYLLVAFCFPEQFLCQNGNELISAN